MREISSPRIEADAEKFDFSAAARLYLQQPEGEPPISRNAIVVGPRGVGKTMLLKTLYWRHRDSATVVPVYLELERWTSRLAVEMTPYGRTKVTPRDRELQACANLALTKGLITGLADIPGLSDPYQIIAPMLPKSLIGGASSSSEISTALDAAIVDVCDGRSLRSDPSTVPLITQIAGAIGDHLRAQDRLLLILLDQADKVSPIVADELARLLDKSGSFVTLIATRPYPTAPTRWNIPSSIHAGDDYALFPLGVDYRSRTWKRFLLDALERHFGTPTRNRVERFVDTLAAVSGGSVRTAMFVTERLALPSVVADPEPVDAALAATARQEIALARNAISAFCASPPTLLRELRELANKSIDMKSEIPNVAMRIVPDERRQLFDELTPTSESLIRVGAKVGIFWPMEEEPWVPDQILENYQISPLVLLGDGGLRGRRFGETTKQFDLKSSALRKWTETPGFSRPQAQRRRGSIFVSRWMSGDGSQRDLSEELARKLGSETEIVTGGTEGTRPWVSDILAKIRRCDLVIVDLTVPRRDIFVELGVAIACEKPTLLAVDRLTFDTGAIPRWIRGFQICPFADDGLDDVIHNIRRILSAGADSQERWQADSFGNSLNLRPRVELVGCVASSKFLDETWSTVVVPTIVEQGLEQRSVDKSHESDADLLYGCIRLARQATTLVLHFDGAHDFLSCLAGGVLAAKQRYNVAGVRCDRRAIVVGESATPLPQIIQYLPGSRVVNAADLMPELLNRVAQHRTWHRGIIAKTE